MQIVAFFNQFNDFAFVILVFVVIHCSHPFDSNANYPRQLL
nr:MAG TPA: hypothetical protein [Caudoviricetes sp.]